jgi:hypothetical protein
VAQFWVMRAAPEVSINKAIASILAACMRRHWLV